MTLFFNQSLQYFAVLLKIRHSIIVPNLGKMELFIFPWQHILETVLIRNAAIQLSNDIIPTLFLNEFSQAFEMFLEMIRGTSVQNVQNFSKKMLYVAMTNTFF